MSVWLNGEVKYYVRCRRLGLAITTYDNHNQW